MAYQAILDDPDMTGPRPSISVIAEGESFDAAKGRSIGTSLFLIEFPAISRVLGMKLKIIASHTEATRFEVQVTPVLRSSLAATDALYRLP